MRQSVSRHRPCNLREGEDTLMTWNEHYLTRVIWGFHCMNLTTGSKLADESVKLC